MSDIIKIEHLNKCFGDVKAVNDLSFRVKKGELFAFPVIPYNAALLLRFSLTVRGLSRTLS